jgi:hypothetical protein
MREAVAFQGRELVSVRASIVSSAVLNVGQLLGDRLDRHVDPLDDLVDVVEVGVERRDRPRIASLPRSSHAVLRISVLIRRSW